MFLYFDDFDVIELDLLPERFEGFSGLDADDVVDTGPDLIHRLHEAHPIFLLRRTEVFE